VFVTGRFSLSRKFCEGAGSTTEIAAGSAFSSVEPAGVSRSRPIPVQRLRAYVPSRSPPRVAQGQRGGRNACVGRGFRRWKMARAAMTAFMPPSSAAPNTPSTASCVTSCSTSYAASFTYPSFTCHPRAGVGGVTGVGRGFRRWKIAMGKANTFALHSSAAPSRSCATFSATSSATYFLHERPPCSSKKLEPTTPIKTTPGGDGHKGALRGIPGSACPQPEPNATELPSCSPISASR